MRAEKRPCLREAYCRICNSVIKKGEQIITWYSMHGGGQHTYLCLECAEDVGRIACEG